MQKADDMNGKLFIIGVGPGDSGLITVKAAQVLRDIKYVFIPVSKQGRDSIAYKIAQHHIGSRAEICQLTFPMLKDKIALHTYYRENQRHIERVLRRGDDAALLTLGDPSTYSTAWYILQVMRQAAPEVDVEIIPGISSYVYGAARAACNLAEGNEVLSVVSTYDSLERIEAVIDASDTVVFLKTYRERQRLLELLRTKGLFDQCIYIKRCGLHSEEIIRDMQQLPDEPEYLSMIILKKNIQPV